MKKENNVLSIILLILFAVMLGYFVYQNVAEKIGEEPKDETPIVENEYETASIKINGPGYNIEFLYKDGMTWGEIADINDNITVVNGYIKFHHDGDSLWLVIYPTAGNPESVLSNSVFDLSGVYSVGSAPNN